ncbi:MAG TPA: hypothetical protein EYO74_00545 [Piscirickettsiaceae bacterium]|jgi:hypothetical protein|nr:hypothetical protein [Piscirickettsiaceae bacterium]
MEYLLNYISAIDPSVRTLPDSVYFIWQTVLIIVVVAIVPLAIFLLQRTLRAALNIKRYFSEMLTAGVAIAENTSSITALNDTIEVATGMVETSAKLEEHSATIATVLSDRATGGSTS